MSILDNVKDRFLSRKDDWDDEYYDDYDDEYSDDYYDDDYEDEPKTSSSGVARWPHELDAAGQRANRLEGGTPLVSNSDVRSTFKPSSRDSSNRVPDYDGALTNYKIEAREGLTRASNHSEETLEAARHELDQLQQGISVPLNSYKGQSSKSNKTASASRRIVSVKVQAYDDAQKVSEAFRTGSSAAVSLSAVAPDLARRVLDFCFGVVSVSAGSVENLGNGVFFLNHGGSPITESEKQKLKDEGIL